MKVNESKIFNYTGTAQQVTLDAGIYLLEAYGASGGGDSVGKHTVGSQGGLGGYTKATIEIYDTLTLHIYIGGAGKYGVSGNSYGGPVGGWNGGGNGGNSASGSGGGATDFRLKHGNWNNSDSLKSRILVAGAGGGADNAGSAVNGSDDGSGGSGGGLSGQGAWIDGRYNAGYGGTQTSGGAFGYGQSVSTNTDTGGAGGGYWGGKCTNHNNGGAGGGSSYIKDFPGCDTTYLSYQGNVMLSDGEMQQGINNGNGYAIVTCIRVYRNRKNSNFYANTIHEETYEYQKYNSIRKTYQENHGFIVGDPICYDEVYKKANLENAINVLGIVSEVIDENTFIYKNSGKISMNKRIALPGDILYLTKDGLSSSPDGIMKPIGIQLPDGIIVKILQAINEEVT